jgi:DHA1 family tetracycline resistance protein-like MFS transporter
MGTPEFQSDEEHTEHLAKFQINPNRAMFTIILTILVDVFGYSMVLPLLPNLVFNELGGTYLMYGIIISSNAVAVLVFSPIWGKLSDKYGRKPILMVSQAGTAAAFLTIAFSNSISVILIARVLDGVFSGQFPVVRAYISDVTTPQTRASKMTKIMVGYTSGMVVGPIISTSLAFFGWWAPMIVAYFITIFSTILTIGVLVESMPKDRIAYLKDKLEQKRETTEGKDTIWTKELGIRFAEVFLLSLMSMIFGSSFNAVLVIRYNASYAVTGSLMSVSAFIVMIYGLFFMKRLIQKVGEKRMLFVSLSCYIMVFLIYPFLTELWMIYVLMIPYGFGAASIGPLLSTNITKATDPDKQGRVSGWSGNLSAISQIVSPIISMGVFLGLGGIIFGLILIGFTNVLLGITLMIITYKDVKKYPSLYAYEKIRKKRLAIQKRKKKAEKQKKKVEKKE